MPEKIKTIDIFKIIRRNKQRKIYLLLALLLFMSVSAISAFRYFPQAKAELIVENSAYTEFAQNVDPAFILDTKGGIRTGKSIQSDNELNIDGQQIRVEVTPHNPKFNKPKANIASDGDNTDVFNIKVASRTNFAPGKYKLTITIVDKFKRVQSLQQDFLWGVLAINPDQSYYQLGQLANISIGVLDDLGNMVCDASLKLKISDPDNLSTEISTGNGDIKVSDSCYQKISDPAPDYYTTIKPTKAGTYTLLLTAETSNGIREMKDSFVVEEHPEIMIKRQASTRIYPLVKNTMKLQVTSNINFPGPVREKVPASFQITPQPGLNIQTVAGYQLLTWDQSFLPGETKTLTYQYDAPDTSPQFFLLGPAEIGPLTDPNGQLSQSDHVFRESRYWEIANDFGTGITISGTVYSAEDQSTNIGASKTMALSVNGGTKTTVETTSGGAFSFSSVTVAANDTVTIFEDDEGSEEATLITQAIDATTNITGLALYTSKVVLTSQTTNAMTNTLLATADNCADDDIKYTMSSSNLTVTSGFELWLESGKTYTPGGNVNTDYLEIRSTATFNPESNTVTVSGVGTPFVNSGTFNVSTSTIKYTGASADTNIANLAYYNLQTYSDATQDPYNSSSNLVAHWKMDESSGTATVADSSGNSNDATSNSTSNVATGRYSNCRTLNGSSPYYITSSLDVQPSAIANLTVSLWIYPERSINWDARQTIWSSDDGAYDRELSIEANSYSFGVFTGTTTVWKPDARLTLNKWQHVVLEYTTTDINFYHNGIKYNYGSAGSIGTTSNYLQFGRNPLYSEYFLGKIDDIQVYNTALSDAEVTHIFRGKSFLTTANTSVSNDLTNTNATLFAKSYNLSVGGSLSNSGLLVAPQAANTFSVSSNLTDSGILAHSAGTLSLNGQGLQTITSGGSDFYNLTVTNASAAGVSFADSATAGGTFTDTTASSKLTFDALSTYNFVNISINGQASGTRIVMASSDPSNSSPASRQWYLNVSQSSPSVSYVDVSNSDATSGNAIDASNQTSIDNGNNENWLFGVTVSGTVYTSEDKGSNIGAGKTIAVSINGGSISWVETGSGGTFSIEKGVYANQTVAIYLSGETEKASLVTQAADGTSDITGLELYTSHIVLTHNTAGPMTNTLLATADNVADTDLLVSVSGSDATFTTGNEVWILGSKTYTPGGNATMGSLDILSTATFTPEANTVTLTDSGTPFAVNGTFNEGTSTVIYTGSSATNVTGTTYNNLKVNQTGTTFTAAGSITVKAVWTIQAGTFDGSDKTITLFGAGTPFVNNDTFTASTSTVKYSGAGDTTITAATYNNLETKPSGISPSGGGWTVSGAGETQYDGTYTAYGTFNGQTSYSNGSTYLFYAFDAEESIYHWAMLDSITDIWDIENYSDYYDGTTLPGTWYAGYGGWDMGTPPTVTAISAPYTYTFATGTINVNGNYTNGDGINGAKATADTNDPVLNVDGNFNNSADATFVASASAGFSVASNFTNNASATFTHSSGTLTLDGQGTQSINSGGDAFNNLTISNTSAEVQESDAATISGTLTINSSAIYDTNGQDLTLTTLANSGTLRMTNGESSVTITNKDTDSGTVEYDGSGTYTTFKYGNTYWNLKISGSGSFTQDAALTVYAALSLTNGTLDTNSSSNYAQTIGTSTTTNGSYSQTGGTFNANASAITCYGNYSVTSGTYTAGTSTLTLDATPGDLTLTADSYSLYNVLFKSNSTASARIATLGSGTLNFTGYFYVVAANTKNMTVTAVSNNPTINITGLLDFTGSGTGTEYINMGSSTWTASGAVDLRSGTIDAGTSTLAMSGATNSSIYGNNNTFYDLTFTRTKNIPYISGATSNFSVSHSLNVADGYRVEFGLGVAVIMLKDAVLNLNSTGTLYRSSASSITFKDANSSTVPTSGAIGVDVYFDTETRDIVIPARTYPLTYIRNATASNFTATLGTAASQTITVTDLRMYANSTGNLTVDGSAYNPDITTSSVAGTQLYLGFYGSGTGTEELKAGSGTWNVGAGIINFSSGTFTAGNSTFVFNRQSGMYDPTLTSGGQSFYNITVTTIDPQGFIIADTLNITNNLSVSATASNGVLLNCANNNPNVTVAGNISMSKAGLGVPSISMGTGTWTAHGNVSFANGTITAGSSTLLLDNASNGQTLTGNSQSLYNLTVTNASAAGISFADTVTVTATFTDVTPSSKLTFDALSTYAFANININGQASGTKITMVSNDPSNADLPSRQWYFNVSQTSPQASYVNVTDSDANGGNTITPVSCTDGGNNENWLFNTAPNVPSSLAQKKVTGGTTLATGDWTNENQVTFSATASDTDNPDTLYLCVEADVIATALSSTNGGDQCGTGVAYSGTPVTVSVTITGLADASAFHWQAQVKDSANAYSSFVAYGGNTENPPTNPADRDFGVDTTAPSGGTVYDGTTGDQDWNDGALDTISANWLNFDASASGLSKYEYAVRRSSDGYYWNAAGATWQSGESWVDNSTNDSATVTPIYLNTGEIYYFAVKATDNAGNTATAVNSNGQQVSPTLSFSYDSNLVSFANLNASNDWSDSQSTTLTTSTNAAGGYSIQGFINQLLTSLAYPSITIPHFNYNSASWSSPQSWPNGEYGFGYTSSDTSVAGSDRFAGATKYAPFQINAPGDIVADHTAAINGQTGAVSNEQFDITYKVAVSNFQGASDYRTYATYIVTANF